MKQFGVITRSLNASQQGLMITNNLNKIAQTTDINPIVFYREYARPVITPTFAMMQEVESWSFPHPVVATTLASAERLLNSPYPTKKFLYVMDLEWLYDMGKNYDYLSTIYANSDLSLIARSQSHADLIEECWKKPVAVVEEFNHTRLLEVIL